MTHEEQRIWLIEQLLEERPDVSDIKIPSDKQEQKDLLRGLMNIRMPNPIAQDCECQALFYKPKK